MNKLNDLKYYDISDKIDDFRYWVNGYSTSSESILIQNYASALNRKFRKINKDFYDLKLPFDLYDADDN